MSRDAITGLAVLAASLVLFVLTLDLKPNALVPIGPGFYPRIVLGICALLAAALLSFELLAAKKPATEKTADNNNYRLVFVIFLIFGVYVGALPFLGYRIATLLFIAVLHVTLEPPRGAKRWAFVGLNALLTTAVTYILFEKYLLVLLPRGLWTDF
jgi:putative tricarboxylic transport membrane protein